MFQNQLASMEQIERNYDYYFKNRIDFSVKSLHLLSSLISRGLQKPLLVESQMLCCNGANRQIKTDWP